MLSIAATALLTAPTSHAAQAPKGFFGVHPRSLANADPSDYVRMGEADVGVIRTGFLLGRVKSHADDPYNWNEFDAIVGGAADNGIDVLPVLYGVPPYVSTKPGSIPLGNSESEWTDYLEALVERYGPDGEFWSTNPSIQYHPITDWQVWNEENALTNWKLDPNPREYGRLLVLSADALRSVDPDAQIVTGGVISIPQNPAAMAGVKFLKKTLRSRAVRRVVDVIAIHPYTGYVKDVTEQIRLTRRMLDDRRVDYPIWVTEIGWGTGAGSRNPLIVSPAKQRANLEKSFDMAIKLRRRLGIGRMVWYQWRDGPNDTCKWCPTSGLLHQSGVAKPLLDVFSRIARL